MKNSKNNKTDTNNKTKDFLDLSSTTEKILLDNEKKANKLIAVELLGMSAIMFVILVMVLFGITNYMYLKAIIFLSLFILCNTIVPIVTLRSKIFRKNTKYLLVSLMIISLFAFNFCFGSILSFAIFLPIIAASAYYDEKFTLGFSIINMLMYIIMDIVGIFCSWYFNMNIIVFPEKVNVLLNVGMDRFKLYTDIDKLGTLKNYFTIYAPIVYSIYITITITCYLLAKRNRINLMSQAQYAEKELRLSHELTLAKDIQTNMLPIDFDSIINKCKNIDIYGVVIGSEEVGGDIYNFFMPDNETLCLMIGDVSGRGAEAALFMNRAKNLFDEYAKQNLSINEIFFHVNNELCKNNPSDLFITAWGGILNVKTGIMQFSCAGQNMQYKGENGNFIEIPNTPNNILLGGIENVDYQSSTLKFISGDKLFLYTDGTISATNDKNEQFGSKRLLNSLNNNFSLPVKELIDNVQSEINTFMANAVPADDMTMLSIEVK